MTKSKLQFQQERNQERQQNEMDLQGQLDEANETIRQLSDENEQLRRHIHKLKFYSEDMLNGSQTISEKREAEHWELSEQIREKDAIIEQLEARLAAESPLQITHNGGWPDNATLIADIGLPSGNNGRFNSASVHTFINDDDEPITLISVGYFTGTREEYPKSVYFSLRMIGLVPTLDDIATTTSGAAKYGLSREYFRDGVIPYLVIPFAREGKGSDTYKSEYARLLNAVWRELDEDNKAKRQSLHEEEGLYEKFSAYFKQVCERSCQNIVGRLSKPLDYDALPEPYERTPENPPKIGRTNFVQRINDENS